MRSSLLLVGLRSTTPRWLVVAALLAVPVAAAAVDGLTAPASARSADTWRYRILLTSDRDGQTRTYSILPNGSRLTPLRARGRPLKPIAVSGDGSTIAYKGSSKSIYVSRADGTGFHRLVLNDGYSSQPVLSRDGASLAFAVGREIWTMGTDGRDRRRVGSGSSPTDWSPDGRALLLVGARGALSVQPLGGRRRVLVRRGTGCCYAPKWSPNGRWIAYGVLGSNGRTSLWVVQLNGARRRLALKAARFAWSPDGRRLAFTVGDRYDVSDVAVAGVKRRVIRRLHLGLSWPRAPTLTWSPEGRRLILTGHLGNDPEQVWMVDRDGRGLRRVTSAGTNSVLGWTRLTPVLPPASPLPPTERVSGAHTLASRTPITDLSAHGRRVAFVPEATATDCEHIAVWTPGKKATRRVSPGLPAPCLEGGVGARRAPAAIYGVALAGSRIAWAEILLCGNYCDVKLVSATLGTLRQQDVSVLYTAFSADEGPRWDFHVHGQGNLLVFNSGSWLVRIGGGRENCEGDPSERGICTTLRRGSHAAPVDSVSEGLIAIRESDQVAVLDAQGTLVRTFPFTPDDVSAARLDHGRLVVARLVFLEQYDVATGARELSRPLPAGYTLEDFDQSAGIALLRRPKTIMLLRLADGASLTLRPSHGPVLADLEAPGLYYSYAVGKRGRLVFVPRSKLLGQLR